MILYYLAIAVFSLYLLRARLTRVNLDHIPALGHSGLLSSYLSIPEFRKEGVRLVKDAYEKFQGRVFKIPFLTYWAVVVGDPTLVNEIKNAKDSDISFQQAVIEELQMNHTMSPLVVHATYQVDAVRSSLTRNIAARFDDIRDEIVESFKDCIPTPKDNSHDWVSIVPLVVMREVVCRVSNRLFLGLPICRDPDWIDLNIQYTVQIFQGAEKIKKWPDFLKPIVGPYYSPYKKAYSRAHKHIAHIVKERIDNFGKEDSEPPNDLISWLLEHASEEERTVEGISMMVLQINMAAIHTSSNTFTYVLFRLAMHPEYAQPMREEVEKIVEELGWSKAAMNQMRKVDSFIRESQRIDNLSSFMMQRKVVNPKGYTCSDGTYLPKDTMIVIPTNAIHHDEKNYQDPSVFDGFRFSKLREADKDDGPKHQMVNTNGTNLTFGNGRHACPGRFFAANELKAMLAHVLLNYDLKMNEGAVCKHYEYDFTIAPSMEKILWRKRV
jgi:cytochrome P450